MRSEYHQKSRSEKDVKDNYGYLNSKTVENKGGGRFGKRWIYPQSQAMLFYLGSRKALKQIL